LSFGFSPVPVPHRYKPYSTPEKRLLFDGIPGYSVVMEETKPPAVAASLKPRLHCKIERMSPSQLALLDRIVLQIEAEDQADRLCEAFDQDRTQGKLQRLVEMVQEFRATHPYR
jgi:hypothetical protein